NGLPARLVTAAEAREYEPEVSCVEALHVASTGLVDFALVLRKLAALLEKAGAQLRLGVRVTGIGSGVIATTAGEVPADVLVNCAGLHADRLARLAGGRPPARIVPFTWGDA